MGNRLQRRSPTIRDVAREAGVSVATISRVLNRREDVAVGTRERVLRVIREQGYTRNSTASALSRGRSELVGVTLPEIKSSYFARLADAIVDALYEHDLRAVFCPTRHERELELTLLERLMHGTTEGAVLILPSESSVELLAVQGQGYPLVVLDPKTPVGPGIPSVSAANTAGAAAATRHLLGLAHRRIAAITGPAGWCATVDRLAGIHAALAEAGIEPRAAFEAEADFEVAGGRAAAVRLVTLPDRPTAIVAFNDNLAIGALQAARELGLALPADLSVVGFDDSEQAPLVTPGLTTVRQPLGEMARMAVSLLTRLLADRPVEALKVELATTLVVRESTAPPPARRRQATDEPLAPAATATAASRRGVRGSGARRAASPSCDSNGRAAGARASDSESAGG
ncbi:MAG TPA: LacI family DNA-binding transcriptional regulator [Gaiellaceae bacterium]|nr:LacI family DNA-binding transcriptional regulator [Gaiellaceae bacterium]